MDERGMKEKMVAPERMKLIMLSLYAIYFSSSPQNDTVGSLSLYVFRDK
jgi:hypothetical protein